MFQEHIEGTYEQGKAVNTATYFEIDEVIDPADSRRWITMALESAPEARPADEHRSSTRGDPMSEPTEATSTRRHTFVLQVKRLVVAIHDGDEEMVEGAVIALSQSRRIFAPLAFVVGAFVMLFDGMKLLISNWRLTLIQVLPAMWIWLAMLNLKAHVLRGKDFRGWYGPSVLVLAIGILLLTAASFYLNAVFAFAIATPGPPDIRPAFGRARKHFWVIIGWGSLVGLVLALSTLIVPRIGLRWFALSMGIAVGAMMYCYVAIPAGLLGIRTGAGKEYSRRDKLAAAAMGGALGAIVCTPPYVIGRVGIIMLGSKALFVPGIFVLALGLTLQAGATGSVKAIKMTPSWRPDARSSPTPLDHDEPGDHDEPSEHDEPGEPRHRPTRTMQRPRRCPIGVVVVIRRFIDLIRFPPPYEGPILSGRIDGVAYLAGWIATFAHLALGLGVLTLGFGDPWPLVSSVTSAIGTVFFITIVIVIHRRLGEYRAVPRDVVWQWWLGPWDPVGRLVWLPVRLAEAGRAVVHGTPAPA